MKQYKSRDKITQKMTRDGLIEVNETQQTAERISKREQDADFQKSPEQQAAQDGTQLQGVASQTSPLPHAPVTSSCALCTAFLLALRVCAASICSITRSAGAVSLAGEAPGAWGNGEVWDATP